ncbi:MoaD/ThiS family protein [Streptomyces phytophilus]|uniref:MoaD/ThiS family protein n=1 Tax=Streptomyces phytophilus TaxID=722715 RepID=UPI0035A86D4F
MPVRQRLGCGQARRQARSAEEGRRQARRPRRTRGEARPRQARGRHGEDLARVLARCSFLVDGRAVGARDHAGVALADGGTVEVLPPFAGG